MVEVFVDQHVLDPFLADAARQYRMAWATSGGSAAEHYLPRCWALLVGEMTRNHLHVRELRWAGNVRESDPVVLTEFSEVIAPCFGSAYQDGRRGYWCDPDELLRITREVEKAGLDVLGSIHMHADIHRFWPEHAKGQQLSECPTAMDEYLFRNGGWPLNVICHLEGVGDEIVPRLGVWAPPPFEDETAPARAMPLHLTLGPVTERGDA